MPETSCLVKIRPMGSRPPLFFLPGAGGMVSYLYPLSQQLDREIPFFAFQAQGLDGKAAPHDNIEAMAEHYVTLLLEMQPHGPYYLAGHSFGGQVAFAIAQILLLRGEMIGLLAIVDSYAPGAFSGIANDRIVDDTSLIVDIGKLLGQPFNQELKLTLEDIEGLRSEEQLAFVAHRLEEANLLPKEGGPGYLQGLLNTYKAHLQMHQRYVPQSFQPLTITLFRASEAMADQPDIATGYDLGWGRYSSQTVPVHYVPGDHLSMMTQPHVAKLAQVLSRVTG